MKTLLLALLLSFCSFSQAEDFKPNFEKKIDPKSKELKFAFASGQVQVRYDASLKSDDLKCELEPNQAPESDFEFKDEYKKFHCEITLAHPMKVKVKGNSGQIQATNLSAETELTLESGQIQFTSNSKAKYKFDAQVENGMKPMLPMGSGSQTGSSVSVKLRVKNGMISVQ